MTWGEILGEIAKKVLMVLVKIVALVLFVLLSGLQVIVRELVSSLRKFLFPHKK